ncbi:MULTISPECIES: hypothetical protein [unclassified Mesorhizobium]|uniref:hypothetical protein n=1 Tax=unclassified Mesorhizobium TaxID=325217 RepID=UPI0003CE3315|nr:MULTISPECIES: hypothetical protein [unclassified Mesorhizobium]ESY57529.1 hypothetical protein X745_01460 [Mesorhizobium sp. LNJC374B00]ESY60228.1 hypothetical protein X744_08185 [Mesorhizobium sp. LNJC372A00]WJI78518.1 hypothetical protein NLY34_16610 [Mesorhizobium sp. C374B]WJI85053.1 hypothetical protein NLY42_19015 [Mesorhizobium sp. C372A]
MSVDSSRVLVTRVALFLWACLSCVLALQWLVDLGMVGFPDGYITPYAQATSTLLHVLVWACLAQSLYFACRALFGKRFEPAPLFLQILIAAALTVVPVFIVKHCPRSQVCSNIYEALTNTMMDDGTGG